MNETRRPRALMIQPDLDAPGGGNSVASVVLETLAAECDVTMLMMSRPDFERANRLFGTSLRASDVKEVIALEGLSAFFEALPLVNLALIRRYLLLWRGRKIASRFDIVVSAANEIDVGRRAIQYIHFPWGYWPRPPLDLKWFHHIPGLLRFYYFLGHSLAPVTWSRMARNRTLVNSAWTGARFAELCDGEFSVLPPPIRASPLDVPWEERENGFAIVGRLSPEKRIHEVIEIIERVRAAGFDVTLSVIGMADHPRYTRRIFALAESRPWIRMRLGLPHPEVLKAIAGIRYGIHGMRDEHFGMAAAEMLRAGCVVFVPDDGGQVEVVRDASLRYSTVGDAVAKIVRLLGDSDRIATLREQLQRDAAEFSVERFRERFREVMREELQRSAEI